MWQVMAKKMLMNYLKSRAAKNPIGAAVMGGMGAGAGGGDALAEGLAQGAGGGESRAQLPEPDALSEGLDVGEDMDERMRRLLGGRVGGFSPPPAGW